VEGTAPFRATRSQNGCPPFGTFLSWSAHVSSCTMPSTLLLLLLLVVGGLVEVEVEEEAGVGLTCWCCVRGWEGEMSVGMWTEGGGALGGEDLHAHWKTPPAACCVFCAYHTRQTRREQQMARISFSLSFSLFPKIPACFLFV
jgi:hypothetical protein